MKKHQIFSQPDASHLITPKPTFSASKMSASLSPQNAVSDNLIPNLSHNISTPASFDTPFATKVTCRPSAYISRNSSNFPAASLENISAALSFPKMRSILYIVPLFLYFLI